MRHAVLLLGVALLAGCSEPDEPELRADRPAFAYSASEPVAESFGIGRAAAPAEIARLDIDVRPDGTGLPAGRGTPAEGARVYAAECAACHGAEGGGASASALVAQGDPHAFVDSDDPGAFGKRAIGNYWPYATTLFDYIRRTMPFDRPGSLSDADVYALVAWLLWQNGLIAEDAELDAVTLPAVEMPARDRFIPDDREPGTIPDDREPGTGAR